MSPCRRYVLAIALGLALTPTPVGAQTGEPRARRLETALAGFSSGDEIRVAFERQGRLRGRLLAVGADSVRLSVEGVEAGVARDAIDGLWSRSHAAGKGALIGGLAGFALGAAYGLLIGEVVCSETSCSRLEVGAVSGLIFGAGGAGAGALIGVAVPVWKQRFP